MAGNVPKFVIFNEEDCISAISLSKIMHNRHSNQNCSLAGAVASTISFREWKTKKEGKCGIPNDCSRLIWLIETISFVNETKIRHPSGPRTSFVKAWLGICLIIRITAHTKEQYLFLNFNTSSKQNILCNDLKYYWKVSDKRKWRTKYLSRFYSLRQLTK